MAKAEPKSKELAKKKSYSPHPQHKIALFDFTKHLHILGVDVSEHLKTFELEKAELEKLEKEESTFISPADSEQLNLFLHNILHASESLLDMENELFTNSRDFNCA